MRGAVRNCLQASLWLLVWVLVGAASAHAANDERLDDWNLLDDHRAHSFGLRLGDGDSVTWGADAELMLPGHFELAADYLRTDFSLVEGNEALTGYSATLRSDPLARWSAQLSFAEAGNSDSLLTQDYGLAVQYRANRWQKTSSQKKKSSGVRKSPL